MTEPRWLRRLLGYWCAEMLGFAPVIALYLSVAFCASCFDAFDRLWLFVFQFLIFELFASLFTAAAAFKLGDGITLGIGSGGRLLDARGRDAGLLLIGLVFVVVMPGILFAWTNEPAKALGMASVFLPRFLELWRVREQARPVARALGYSALSGPLFLLGVFALLMLLGAAANPDAPVDTSEGAQAFGILVAIYYVVVATFTSWMRLRVESWRT
jgi:hypothetical protein